MIIKYLVAYIYGLIKKYKSMKKLHTLLTGILLFGAFQLSAQGGSTPHNGQNPEDQKSVTSQQMAGPGNQNPLNGNGSLGPAYQGSECGLNYTTASQKLGQRFFPPGVLQPATFTIAGIPAGSTIVKAFIWCDASGNGAPIVLNIVNPSASAFSLPMTLVGTDADKCWGYAASTTYRADVTATINPLAPNGGYTISGFPTGPPNDVDGATLMIIYKEPNATFQGDLIIWDGAVVGIGVPTTQTMTGFTACNGNISNARAFAAFGDFQGYSNQITLNGNPPVTVVEDWWNYVDMPTTVFPGQNTSLFGNSVSGDCYNFCLMGLYFQSTCTTCEYECEAKPDFKTDGCNPIQFDGFNTGGSPVLSWYWTFGDGGTSTLEDPSHSYAAAGTYEVCLTIISKNSKGETCCGQICHKVDVCDPKPCSITPNFNYFVSPNNPLQVAFTDASTYTGGSICFYKVDFGDGSPVYVGPTIPSYHVYALPGTYTVCMSVVVCVYDAAGNVVEKCEDKICKNVIVGGGPGNGRVGQTVTPTTNSAISVFPSPTNNLINVTVADDKPVQVRILNANGQQVAVAKSTGKNTYQADVASLAAGVYFVTVQGADGAIRKQSFVKE